jgi:hypothetical protein
MSAVPLAHTQFVWHHWLSFAILVPTLLVVIGIILGYLAKVVAPKYGRR